MPNNDSASEASSPVDLNDGKGKPLNRGFILDFVLDDDSKIWVLDWEVSID